MTQALWRLRKETRPGPDDLPHWQTTRVFSDGEAVFEAVWRNGLEGVVAKRLSQPHKPGERGWVKTKNRHYWRYPLEVAAARGGRSTASRF